MTKRERLLGQIQNAAYNGDDRTAIRIYCENRISYEAFVRAVQRGREARERRE